MKDLMNESMKDLIKLQTSRMPLFERIDSFADVFQRFCLNFSNIFLSDQLSMAVSNKFSCSCGKSPE